MGRLSIERLFQPFAQVREKEVLTTLLMFSYSFLAMAAYNVIKPVTRSKYIDDLGSDNLPYVLLAAGALISVVMAGYSWLMNRVPRRWCLSIAQGGIFLLLVAFWFLFRTDQKWVSVAFYFLGLIFGILLISQFWTLANVVYDPRQAKRLFGFIGGGSSLGSILGSFLAVSYSRRVGTVNLLLFSITFMVLCLPVVMLIIRRERVREEAQLAVVGEEGVGAKRALDLLRKSKHLRLIALVISFASIGAVIIDVQLSMAAEAFKGRQSTDAITEFLGQVQLWTSTIGFVIQILLTSRIHRYFGIGFALLLLPTSLGTTAVIMLLNAALWAPGLARIVDQSLRYTVDKTTREILYMPLPADIKFEAKPFVDVTVDRFAKGLTAVLLLVLIKPWGLGLNWQKLSCASIVITGVWVLITFRAKRGYQAALRQSIEMREMKPAELRIGTADLSTIETLIQELASPDERRVLYAIDMLESLDKRNLVTPLLLYHESPAVRIRALAVLSSTQPEISAGWLPAVQRMIGDENPQVRVAAVCALATLRNEQATELARPLLEDRDPRIAMTAAMVLAGSERAEDVAAAEAVLTGLVSDTRESVAQARRDFAIAIRHVPTPHYRRLLIPLLYDADLEIAEEAMRSIRQLGTADFIFVPTLISMLRHRRLKSSARELLVGYGEPVLGILMHFLRDPEEDIWVRRHIPATIARIPCQKAMDLLIEALEEPDGFLRFKVIAAIEKLHRMPPELAFKREPIEALALKEAARHFHYLQLQRKLLDGDKLPKESLLACAVAEKIKRTVDRVYRLLGLLYPWKEIAAARYAIERGDSRSRAAALEYLDNVLTGPMRKKVVPLLEEVLERRDISKRVPGALEEAVLRLINDEDSVISASAVHFAWQRKLSDLVDELERVLATRDVRDWYVFEAVSWVLAGFRMPEARRRVLWLEPLPAVELAERLRSFPLFASVTIDELFRIVDAGRQMRHDPWRVLFQEGAIPESLQFLLDGCVAVKAATGDGREVGPPAALAFQEVLEGRAMRETVRTTETTVCLALSSDETRTLLADSIELVQGLFQILCSGADSETRRLVLKGDLAEKSATVARGDLKPIDKALILQDIPLFSDVSADEMLSLASIAGEVRLATGSVLFGEADAPGLWVLLSGELSLESSRDEPALAAGPGDVIGVCETLAGVPLERHARVVREGTALRIDREELFDLLSQRPDLLQQLFSALFRAQRAESTAAEV